MSDQRFQQQQWNQRFAPNIERINNLVDALIGEGGTSMPYVAPLYGGLNSKVLFVFQDPGPGTNLNGNGSGFLCSENNDPSAELFATCLDQAGLSVGDVITWNAYPWHLPAGKDRPTNSQVALGVAPLHRLLALLPNLKVIMPMGRVAQGGWARFVQAHPSEAARYKIVPGLHTSRRGITGGGQHSKEQGVAKVVAAMYQARQHVA